MFNKIKLIIGIIILAASFIFGLSLQIKNPDMTEIRLIITYWKECIMLFIFVIIGCLAIFSGIDEI